MSTSFPPVIHMFSTGRSRSAICAGFLLLSAARLPAQPAPAETTLYRVFLRDGSTVLSYGELARVSDRIIVTVPLGPTPAAPDLHMLSLPSDSVDWEKTDAYADSVRAARYATTRGPDEFAMLSGAVSTTLADIGLTTDPARKIAMAAEARQNVTRWVAEHYGYRAEDVAQMASLFDDVVAETRAAAGVKNFDLSLIANLAAPPSVPLLPAPPLRQMMEQALGAAMLAPDATERTSLLGAIDRALLAAGGMSAWWAAPLHARVAGALAIEDRATREYQSLTRVALRSADLQARTANVTGVERVIRRALGEDDRLGRRRPQEMASLLAMLDGKLDAARRLRLARDSWAERAGQWSRYGAALAAPIAIMQRSRDALDAIRRLAGPSRARLATLDADMARATALVGAIASPADAADAHSLLTNAIQLASRAARSRQRAVASGDMQTAWEASAAAAGAVMLFDRASEDLKMLQTAPRASRRP
ncbi:MAG: hypothetical protein QOI42_1620 [Frankiaceae bacterium]|nr:hypothetical protein [Frankiaceae bacterium]